MQSVEQTQGGSLADNFGSGTVAMVSEGSWNIGQYTSYDGIDVQFSPTPIGPSGQRASMFNGLADSIWSGTDNPEGSKKWVEYLASAECQDTVAEAAVVFPAITTSAEKAAEAFAAKVVDVSPFTIQVEEGTTFLFPITENADKIANIMRTATEEVMIGNKPASSLTEANDEVNALFE